MTTNNDIQLSTVQAPLLTHLDDTSDSEEDIILRSRGRLASRTKPGIERQVSPQPVSSTEDVRDRVRKLLGLDKPQKADQSARGSEAGSVSQENDQVVNDEVDDEEHTDDVTRGGTPKRRYHKEHSRTPTLDSRPNSSHSNKSSSSGMFVSQHNSPAKSLSGGHSLDTYPEQEPYISKNDRFKALVERKRHERLAKEAEEERKRMERLSKIQDTQLGNIQPDDETSTVVTDDEGDCRLTQQNRPPRKAGKKALEEMNRETQRMARNMQLEFEPAIRDKYTIDNLFDMFDYYPDAPVGEFKFSLGPNKNIPLQLERNEDEMRQTTPSLPPPNNDTQSNTIQTPDDRPKTPKETSSLAGGQASHDLKRPGRRIRVKLPTPTQVTKSCAKTIKGDDGEDGDLEIIFRPKSKLDAVFDKVPAHKDSQSRSLMALRRLAQVTSPSKDSKRVYDDPWMTSIELQSNLAQKVKEQIQKERKNQIEILKSQGFQIQTEEEREWQLQEVEDLISKARKEAENIMKQEREEADQEKRKSKENRPVDPLAWDDSADEEYQGEEVEEDIQYSGSDDSEIEVEDEDMDDSQDGPDSENDEETVQSPLIKTQLENEGSPTHSQDEEESEIPINVTRHPRRTTKTVVDSDDEDDDNVVDTTPTEKATPVSKRLEAQPATATKTCSPLKTPTSVLRSATKPFIPGLPVTGPAGLGLTQIFAGTIDDSQMVDNNEHSLTPSMAPDFDPFPDPNKSDEENDGGGDTASDIIVMDSQVQQNANETQEVDIQFVQSQMHGFDSMPHEEDPNTQFSDIVNATQDAGLRNFTPLQQRFLDHPASTVETVLMSNDTQDVVPNSPPVTKGRLLRKADLEPTVENTQPDNMPATTVTDEFGFGTTTAFSILKEAAQNGQRKRPINNFDKKQSKANEMVDEQAAESDDEYAGLGGVDGENSDDDDDDDLGSVKDMIDDEGDDNVDEAKLAAFYADHERANDEQQVEKLFRDLTNGMLRRKRGADYDLSDSDDDGEARRRLKRRQFAKMQKTLYADERIKKIAEKPGSRAFLRTIEDRDSDDDDIDMAVVNEPAVEIDEESQSQPRSEAGVLPDTILDSQSVAGSENQRRSSDNPAPVAAALRRHPRRTQEGYKPSSIGEIRESLSSLLEEPNTQSTVPATEIESESDTEDIDEYDEQVDRNHAITTTTITNGKENPRRSRVAVIDRITLKRASSSALSETSTTTSVAFAAPSRSYGSVSSFRVPALLRRATTNNSITAASGSNGSSTNAISKTSGDGSSSATSVRKSQLTRSGQKSGVRALGAARDLERHAAVHESEKRREQRRQIDAGRRQPAMGKMFGAGQFE